MPTLIANAPSRIVIVSSVLHKGPPMDYEAFDRMSSKANNAKKGWGVMKSYQQSKLANLLFARGLASKYKDQRITAYSLHPGMIDTHLTSRVLCAKLCLQCGTEKKHQSKVQLTTVYCALKAGLESETGRYFDDFYCHGLG